ncbi:MAG TPA: hypothetical protein VKG92_08700 [Flavobacteriales bacterium]|nr:hypothetical protein [Flavobacteriales bacterium]
MRAPLLLLSCAVIPSLHAQLANGSFEDDLGNYADSGWVATCTVMPGPGAPGLGAYSVLVPHSNAPGCGWSRLDQLVPIIGDGETWTLSGWCANFTWMFADPYSGFRFGIKRANGDLDFNTAALQNTGSWTHLSVTNSFTLAPGDTVFVECDPGTVSGLGENQVWAMFDGVELVQISTGMGEADAGMHLHMRPNPVVDRLWIATDVPLLELRIISMDGAVADLPFTAYGSTTEVDVADLAPGAHVVWARTKDGVRTTRFVKL